MNNAMRKTTSIAVVKRVVARKKLSRNGYKRLYVSLEHFALLVERAEKRGYHVEGVTDESCAVEEMLIDETLGATR